MEPQITVHIQTLSSPSHLLVGRVLHAYTGSVITSPEGDPAGHDHQPGQASADHGHALQDIYCTMMTSPHGGLLDVQPEHCQVVTSFIRTRRPLLSELRTIILSTSPDAVSQEQVRQVIHTLREVGIDPADIKILFVDAPEDMTTVNDSYPIAVAAAREAQIVLAPKAKLSKAIPFEKMQQLKVPVASILNGTINFEAELTAARLNGAPEKFILALAHKVIAQRELLRASEMFEAVVDALGLTRISREEWRAATPTPNRKRAKLVGTD